MAITEIGLATRPGTELPSGDAAAAFTVAGGTATAVSLVDGIGHSDRVAEVARMLAEVAARVAAHGCGCSPTTRTPPGSRILIQTGDRHGESCAAGVRKLRRQR